MTTVRCWEVDWIRHLASVMASSLARTTADLREPRRAVMKTHCWELTRTVSTVRCWELDSGPHLVGIDDGIELGMDDG
jgi:hypothetical protein